jgi:hypothetical protein
MTKCKTNDVKYKDMKRVFRSDIYRAPVAQTHGLKQSFVLTAIHALNEAPEMSSQSQPPIVLIECK